MHEVLREFLHQFVLVYIDDILIYSRSEAEHRQHVAEVLQRLRENNLFLKVEKCSFHQSSVKFLGYHIDQYGIKMDEGKVTAIQNCPMPTSIKELQRFLGFANFYRRLIQNYSSIAGPLTDLLKRKPKSLSWTPSATESFNILKETFITAPILVHLDPNKAFVVEVNASTARVGAVLSQQQGTPAKLHPCAFFSCKLSPAEKNYDIGNRELLAIKLALEEWRHWLEGVQEPFVVLTDHKNLEYLREAKRLNPRQARWALFFTRFHLLQTRIPESESGCVISSPRTRRGQPIARTHPSRRHVPMSHPMGPRVHSYSQCLYLRTAGLSTRSTVRSSNTTYPHHSLGTFISGHWLPRGQWNPLAAKRSLLVAQHGPRREKVRTRMLRLCHLQESPPPSIWQTTSAARSNPTMVTFRSGLHNRSPTI